VPGDEPRFLSRSGFPPYVDHPARALRREPEAVDADTQEELCDHAARRERDAWRTARDRLLADIEHIATHVKSPHVRRATRALQREVAALDRKLA
jgi:hypothetical protein